MKKESSLPLINSDFRRFRVGETDSLAAHISAIQEEVVQNGTAGAGKVLANFARYARTMDITRLLVFYEVFKKTIDIQGSVIDMGVLHGNSLFAMAHFSEIFEHRNYVRKIYGFDTFEGNPLDFDENDAMTDFELAQFKFFNKETVSTKSQLEASIKNFDADRFMQQFEKIHLVQGDASKTIPAFVKDNPGLVVSLLICGTDIYKPTLAALKHFYPLMPKGGVVLFGAVGFGDNPGETRALQEVLGIGNVKLERFPFATKWNYFVK
jgi:hypothetical protein